jgi:hypothetical protein
LRALPLDNLITTLPPNARDATCGLFIFPHSKLQISESSTGELLKSSEISLHLLAQSAVLVQGHTMLKPLHE